MQVAVKEPQAVKMPNKTDGFKGESTLHPLRRDRHPRRQNKHADRLF